MSKDDCTECKGTGECPSCDGEGTRRDPLTGDESRCRDCNGEGDCADCNGHGTR